MLVADANKLWIMVVTLPRKNGEVVQTHRIRIQVVLADERCVITGLLHDLRQCRLRLIESGKPVDAVLVRVFACEYCGSTRRADRVRHEAVCEEHALFGKAVDIGGRTDVCQHATIGADRLGRVIVGHDEKDVWPTARSVQVATHAEEDHPYYLSAQHRQLGGRQYLFHDRFRFNRPIDLEHLSIAFLVPRGTRRGAEAFLRSLQHHRRCSTGQHTSQSTYNFT